MLDIKKLDLRPVPLPEAPPPGSAAAERERERIALVRAEIEAVSDAELLQVNVHIPRAATRVIGVATHLAGFRDQILAMPGFEARHFDLLPTYAREARAAHLTCLTLGRRHRSGLRATPLRKMLAEWRLSLRPLAHRGVISADLLVAPEGRPKNEWVARAVLKICLVLRALGEEVSTPLGLTEKHLRGAERAATRLIDLDPIREAHDSELARRTLRRQKAFVAFFRAYDQVRRAMTHIRWAEGDVDDLAPSLHRRRGARRAPRASVTKEEK